MIKTLAIFTELSKPKLLRAEFYLSPLLQEIEEPALIKKEFLQHFKNFLGTADSNGWGGDTEEIRSLLSHFLTDEQGSALVALMTADDVKKTIFLKANKAQGIYIYCWILSIQLEHCGENSYQSYPWILLFLQAHSQPIIFNVNVPFSRENLKQSLFPL